MRHLICAAALTCFGGPLAAAPLCDDLGFAGLLASCNRGETIQLTLASGKPLGEDVVLESGAYYKLEITADGSAELAIEGPSFFRAIWMNEIVINQIEIRPMAIDSIEFDKAGVAELSFIAIKPGRHVLRIPGSTGESQSVTLSIQ
ncbi:conserved hypothetical protein [Dinoroseobacter shibae DFL 12 = DSM 16493]|uniref:MSP domain-containing protein n=1 Tax=Dinoroseobacter shibae (strain DSM 16493 / NCIMB 14021 / DFL 12) TaxID=398580 RepID=A8LNS5_DINSH|nr:MULTISPECIES: hypothetical protein [Dinoroseobacter]ABV92233.1 conserved hypothetical protein [Dinoroseobacter shibae DFL 12 = DSM 16493]MDD9717432.1 hypothetical protein [Dinoroseobacter sp. PD6]URF47184.1 hypothetical protein M8008_02480 [Dinoroseobacter shibae]URF51495.1 hypothetical protein M8007_02480 [Dinoroseobacter shibae]